MWYKINDDWYYFDRYGIVISNSYIKVNNKKYFLDSNGKLRTDSFTVWFHKYGTLDSGAVIEKGGFDYKENYYETYLFDHGIKKDMTKADVLPTPRMMWKNSIYVKGEPAYFFKKDFSVIGRIETDIGEYPRRDGEQIGITEGAVIYEQEGIRDVLFIYDETDNSFYSYEKQNNSSSN